MLMCVATCRVYVQMDMHMGNMHAQYGGPPPMNSHQMGHQQEHRTPPHQAKHLNHLGQAGDSPGFSEDFPHLALINDLLDDSMFG